MKSAEFHNRHLVVGHHRRFNRYVLAAKGIFPSLGKIIAVSGLWTIYKPPAYFESPTEWRRSSTVRTSTQCVKWRCETTIALCNLSTCILLTLSPDVQAGGPILINLIHEIDILHFWFGPIVRVYAERSQSQRGHEAEEGAAITLRFASGVVGTFVLSDAVVSPLNFESGTGENPTIPKSGHDCYRIFGSEASLSFPDMTRWSYQGQRSWTENVQNEGIVVPDMRVPFELQIENFVKVVRGEDRPSCSGRDGLRSVMVCEAIKKSMEEAKPVEIPLEF